MDTPTLFALTLAALGTAALSATFGMAGGLLLMGVYTALLPVPAAMVLHGVTQLVANGGRAWLLRTHVHRGGLLGYAAGAVVAWGLLAGVRWVPSEAAVYLGIGAVPFVAAALPPTAALDFGRRRGAALCGLLVVGTQLAFGVAGPLLDVFFVRTALLRREVVATKATTQALSHTLKIGYFLPMLAASLGVVDPDPATAGLSGGGLAAAAALTVGAALVGTRLGGVALEHIGEEAFRRWTRRLVLGIGALFLVRGVWALG